MTALRQCTKCQEFKPATTDYFPKHPALGLNTWCKACKNAYERQRRLNPDVQQRERERKSTPEYKQKAIKKDRRYRSSQHYQSKKATPDFLNRQRVRTLKRTARKLQLPDDYTVEQWSFALDYFNHCCAACGRPAGLWHTLAADHWIPLSHPDCPGTVPSNIVPLCHGDGGCNNGKSGHNPRQWLIGKFGKRKAAEIEKRINTFFEVIRTRA